jgi:hypothetical protein
MFEVRISGQARLAVSVSDQTLLCLGAGQEHPEVRSVLEYDYFFAGVGDLRVARCRDWKDVSVRLQTAIRQDDALTLLLILLDRDADNEARREALPLIEEFLADPEVPGFLLRRLSVAPLPESADLAGSMVRAESTNAPAVAELVRSVSELQTGIQSTCAAWEAIPADLFISLPERASLKRSLRDYGVFHLLAVNDLQAALKVLNDWPANQRLLVTALVREWNSIRYPTAVEAAFSLRTGFLTRLRLAADEGAASVRPPSMRVIMNELMKILRGRSPLAAFR